MLDYLDLFFLLYSVYTSIYILFALSFDLYTLFYLNYNNLNNEIVKYLRSLDVVLINIFIVGPIYILFYTYILLYGFNLPNEIVYVYDFNAYFNIFYELINVIITLLSAEFFFYFSHRLFHSNKYLYKKVHKLHHKYSISTYGMHAQYCSTYESIMNLITLSLGTMLVKHHIITIIIQSSIMIAINVIGHTTNEFKLFGKLIYSTKQHNDHHLLQNVNYGLMSICDKYFNTYK